MNDNKDLVTSLMV